MKRASSLKRWTLLILISVSTLAVTHAQTSGNDKKPKKQKQVRDLDDALQELDRGEMELHEAMAAFEKGMIDKEINAAMKTLEVDMARMKSDIAKALKEVDAAKINAEVQKGLADMQKELQAIDGEKMRREIEASLAKIDVEKMKAEMKKVKEMDLSNMRKEMESIRPEIERSLKEAQKDIEKARKEITSYKNLVDALDRDGLLKKEENYKVEYNNNELTVNGTRLSADAVRKYSQYLEGKKNFTIRKEDDDFNIHHK